MRTSSVLLSVAASLLGLQSVSAVNIQSPKCRADASRAAAVKAAYRRSYQAYLDLAAPADELQPLSKRGTGGFGGWGATLIDSATTSFLMGHMDYFQQSVEYAEKVDFTTSVESDSISLFETNIRYVGALLSAYELGGKKNPALVKQAVVIGDHLLTGWVGDNDLPYNTLQDWNTFGAPKIQRAIIAETGTLIIELSRLSKFSGDPKYLDHAVRAMNATINSKQKLPKGLYGQGINATTGVATDSYSTWGGGSDSFYEYLLKYGQLIGSSSTWIPAWVDTVKAAVEYLITTSGGSARKWTYLTDYSPPDGGQIPRFSHLGCFAGGNFILGGKLLKSQAVFDYGIKLTEGCLNTYTASPTGLGPETFVFKNSNGSTNGVRINNPKFYQQNGFDFEARDYILRPEVLESVWYAYRTTGDRRWQDAAWRAFQSIEKYLVSDSGAWAGIDDVTNTKFPELLDTSQSFAYAETFKYIYLIFADPSVASLDLYTFNTEGHPFLQDDPLYDYSSIQVGALPAPRGATAAAPTKTRFATPPLPVFSGMPQGAVQGEIQKALDGLLKFFGGAAAGGKSRRAHQ